MSNVQLWSWTQLPSDTRFATTKVGGLSGIDYRPSLNDYLLVTDDRGSNGSGRAYRAVLDLNADRTVAVRILEMRVLRQHDGRPFTADGEDGVGVDAEAIRSGYDGFIYWTSEGGSGQAARPEVFRMRWSNGHSQPLALPPHLQPDRQSGRGPRDNRSFEGLWVDPGGDVWLGLEAPLREDGELPTIAAGSRTRIVRIGKSGTLQEEYQYPLEPIATQVEGRLADNGLSELIVLPGPAFLVLERSGSQQPDGSFRFTSRIFCAYPTTGSQKGRPTVLSKHLVAQLNALGPFDDANFEGMTFGPRLPDGSGSLILVADNDFRDERQSIFAVLAFR